MKKVAHFVRKSTQLKASFIKTQISHHISFEPFIIFRKNVSKLHDGGFADFDLGDYDYLDLSEGESPVEKINYKSIRILSRRQVNLVQDFIQHNHIDICHFHYGTDCGVYYPLTRKLKIPSVVSFYGYDAFSFPEKFWDYGRSYLYNRVFNHVTRVMAMTPEMKKDLLRAGCPEEKIIVHYYGVPSLIFRGIKSSYHQTNRHFTLLNISSFDPVKGHIFIFEALNQLLSQGIDNIRLRIAGSGFFEPELRKLVTKSHLDEFVSFLGPLKYGSEAMMNELKNADAFIHPSVLTKNDKEGVPGALVEAMFAGLPVISTFHGGIPYVVEYDKTGLLVKEWDVAALAEKIKLLLNDAHLRDKLGRSAQRFALEHLDLHKKEQELENIYNSLLE